MKSLFGILIILLSASFSFAQNPNFDLEKVKQIKKYQSTQLENGLTVISLNTGDSTHFFVRSFTNVPEYVELEHQATLAIDIEMQNIGRLELPPTWTMDDLKGLKIKLNKDFRSFYGSCNTESLDTMLYIFSALIRQPQIVESEMKRAKTSILERADTLKRKPLEKIDNVTKSIIYGKSHPSLKYASADDITIISKEKQLEFYKQFYRPNNTFLLVMGPLSHDSIVSLATKSFSEWKQDNLPESTYKLLPIEEPKVVFFDSLPTGKKNIKIMFPFALHPFSFNAEKAELLSDLFQKMVTDRLVNKLQMASTVDARFESDKITGNYQLNVKLEKDSINLVIETIIATIADLKSGKYSEGELTASKQKIIKEFKKHKTDEKYISGLVLKTVANNLEKGYYADFVDEISNVHKSKIMSFVAKYLNYNTALFQVQGVWYETLNDFIKLSKKFRIELYELDGKQVKVIPKGFNGFSVINNFANIAGGAEAEKKIKDLSIKFGAIYTLPQGEELFVEGVILHKDKNRYFTERKLIRPKQDTLLIHYQIFDGINGFDSTMQGKKLLTGDTLNFLKYKAPFIPELKYKQWNYKAKLVKAVEVKSKHSWVVVIKTPEKRTITDYYDVDNWVRYKREIQDSAYFNERTIEYRMYKSDRNKKIVYPYMKTITSKNTTIKMIVREMDFETKIDKKLFDFIDD